MAEQKKLSRRDAMKALGAALGATALATLPPEWSKPALAASQLPEHARQSVCYAVYIEVLAADGTLAFAPLSFPAPLPDVFSTAQPTPITTGDYLGWYCQDGCWTGHLILINATSASVQITTIAHQFTLNLDGNNKVSYDVLVNMGTGEYTLDGAGSAGTCVWP